MRRKFIIDGTSFIAPPYFDETQQVGSYVAVKGKVLEVNRVVYYVEEQEIHIKLREY
jgi:hypothetical protein